MSHPSALRVPITISQWFDGHGRTILIASHDIFRIIVRFTNSLLTFTTIKTNCQKSETIIQKIRWLRSAAAH
uniref:Uncharacterized protein n=1 Tax=Pararge aegeria TaxID=116150 RepID=S4P1T0_9NEOP